MDSVTSNLPIPERALAIGAHPDDIEFGAGATLAKWAAQGCSTHLVILTDGSKGSWDSSASGVDLIAGRQQEQRAAAEQLGAAGVHFVGAIDGELEHRRVHVATLSELIRRLRPNVVLGHDPWKRYRIHPDHRAAGWITLDAIVAARDHLFFPELDLPPHRPQHVLLFEPDSIHHQEQIDDWIDAKTAALLCHRSQWISTMGLSLDADKHELAEFSMRIRSSATSAGGAAVESFALMRDV